MHGTSACPFYQPNPAPRPPTECVLSAAEVETLDVPADGNCLFHAVGAEIQHSLPNLGPAGTRTRHPGDAWRAAVLRHVETSRARTMDDHTPKELLDILGWKLPQYLARMRQGTLHKRTWGGQFEVSVMQDIMREQQLRIVILMLTPNGDYRVAAGVGPQRPEATVYVAWTGSHYRRARVRRLAAARIAAWCQAT